MKKKFYFLPFLFILLFTSISSNGFSAEPPYLDPIPDQTALVGQLFTLDIDAINANPAESYELTTSRPGMNIDPVTGVITWTPAELSDGGTVTVRAYNSAGESVRSFKIFLSDAIECPAGLLSYWKLDSIQGDSVYADYAGGYDAYPGKALIDTIGVVEGGQVFKPTTKLDKFLTVKDSLIWARSDNFSYSFWFKFNGNNLGNNQALIGKGKSNSGVSMFLLSLDNSSATTKLKFELKNKNALPSEVAALTSSTTIQKGVWYHVAAVYQGSADPNPVTMKLYVNGSVDSKTVNNFDGTGYSTKSNTTVGYWDAYLVTNTYPFNGALDEISLFSKALTAAEVTEMYTNGQSHMPLCRPGNYAPLITTSPALTATQDVAYTYTMTTLDYEGDPVDSFRRYSSFLA